MVGASDAEAEHGLGIGLLPPGACEFEALLDDMAMGALDLAGADGEVLVEGLPVAELGGAGGEITVGGADGCVDLVLGLDVGAEGAEDGREAVLAEACLLATSPGIGPGRRDDGGRGGGEVSADVPEVDEVGALGGELFLELGGDPIGPAMPTPWTRVGSPRPAATAVRCQTSPAMPVLPRVAP